MKRYDINNYSHVELESHIRSVGNSAGQYKTILITGPNFYQVVTRVNNITIRLWIEHINSLIKQLPKGKFDPIQRISWIVTQKNYRRALESEIKNKLNDLNQD